MSVQEASPTLAIRLERTLHSFLEAVTANRGLEDYIDNLAGLFKEVLLEKELGRLDQRTSDLGASVATALQGMSSVFLDITQQGRRIKMQLDEDIIRRVKAHQQPRSRSNAQANASDLHGLVDDASPAAPTSSVRLLRNWFLAHLEHPFPTAEEKATLCSTVDMSVGQVNGWMINMRRRSGWTQVAREIAESNHDRMRELVLDFKLGQASTLSRDLLNAIERVEAYVDERTSDRVRDWMLNVIDETTASVRDGRDQLGDDSEPEDEDDNNDDDRSGDDSDLLPPAPKRKVSARSAPAPASTPAPRRPVRAAAKKASDAVKEDALSSEKDLRTIRSLPRLRSAPKQPAPLTVSVTLPSSPLLPPPSLGSATRSRTRRLSEGAMLVGSQAIVGHGVPSTALQRTSSIRDTTVRNSSGSSFDSTVPGTPDASEDAAEPIDDFHLPSPLAADVSEQPAQYGQPPLSAWSHHPSEHAPRRPIHLPAPYRPQYGTPAPMAPSPSPPSHAYPYGGHPHETRPDAYPHPYPYSYPHPYPAEYASYGPPAEPYPAASRPSHPRQYSWAGEQPSAERQAKRPTKRRRALSQQLLPPPLHQQYYAPPHAYGYHPMHHAQHPHHAQYVKQEPHAEQAAMPSHYASMPAHHVLPPLPPAPSGSEADRLAVLRARKERMAAEQEEIRLEEERLGLANH